MQADKLSKGLTTQLLTAQAADMLDVIVEIEPPATAPTDKSATIAQFAESSAPVAGSIEELGGKVIGSAWINSTVRAQIPARAVNKLASLQNVERIDVPHALKLER